MTVQFSLADLGGDSLAKASALDLVSGGFSVSDFVGRSDLDDWYKLTLTAAQAVELSLLGLAGGTTTRFRLFEADGKTLANVYDDSISDTRFTGGLSAGTYYIAIDSPYGDDTAYTLKLASPASLDGPAAHGPIGATSLGTLSTTVKTVTDRVDDAFGPDVYTFTLSASTLVNLRLGGLGYGTEAYLRLTDAAGNVIVNQVAQDVDDGMVRQQLGAGTYYVTIDPSAGNSSAYTLTAWTGAPTVGSSATDQAGSDFSAAKSLGTITNGKVALADYVNISGDTSDFYKFVLSGPSRVAIAATGFTTGTSAFFALYDGSGNQIRYTYAEDSIVQTLATGTYYVELSANSGASGYNLQVQANLIANAAGKTRATATALGALTATPVSKSDFVGTIAPDDYYSFTLNGNSLVSLNLSVPNGRGYAYFEVLNAAGTVVATRYWDGNYYYNNGAYLAGTSLRHEGDYAGVLGAGTYYIHVHSDDSDKNYTLTASAVAGPDGPVGRTLGTATSLGTLAATPVSKTDWLGEVAPTDYYSFKLAGASIVTLKLSGVAAQTLPTFTVYTSGGTAIISSDQYSNTGDESAIVLDLGAGTYYVRFDDVAGGPSGDGAYTLTASAVAAPNGAGGKTIATAVALPGGITASQQSLADVVGGVVAGDAWYKFTLASTQTVNFLGRLADYVSPGGGSFAITITDGAGNEVDQVYGPVDANQNWSQIAVDLAAGTYYVHVQDNSGNRTPYTVTYWTGKPLVGSNPAVDGANDLTAARDLGTLAASPVTVGEWVGKNGATTDPRDVYAFTVGARGVVTISLASSSLVTDGSTYEVTYDLYDAAGQDLGTGHSNLADGNIDEDNFDLGAGNYYVIVRPATATGSIGYGISARIAASLADGVGDDFVTARNLGVIGTTAVAASDISNSGDPDFYRFQLGSRSTVTLALSTQVGSDLRVKIFAADGSVVEEHRYNAYGAPALKLNLAAGDYYVSVEEVSGREPYALAISGTAAASSLAPRPVGSDLVNPEVLGTLGTAAVTVNGWVGNADPRHTYAFTLDETSLVNLNFVGRDLDARTTLVEIRDADNNVVNSGYLDALRGGQMASPLAAGSYFVTIANSNAEDTSFALSLSATPLDGTAGHTLATATVLTPSATSAQLTDWVSGQSDVYKFTMAAADKFNVNLVATKGTHFRIIDALGNQITDDQWGAASASVQLAAGTYFMLVDAASTDINSASPYTLTYSTGATVVGSSGTDGAGNSISAAASLGALGTTAAIKADWIGGSDPADFYKFTLSKVSTVDLGFSGIGPDAGFLWEIFDTGGERVVAGYDDGYSSSIALGAGTYYLGISSIGYNLGYRLRATASALPDAAGKTLAAPMALGTLGSAPVSVSDAVYSLPNAAGASDFYSFTLSSLSKVSLKLSNVTLTDGAYWQILLFDAAGNQIDAFDSSLGNEPTLTETLQAGTYRLQIRTPVGGTVRYTLSASATAGPDGPASHTFAGATALPALTATPTMLASDWVGINDGLGQSNGLDYYKFTLTSAAQVTFEFDVTGLSGPGGQIGLLDQDGNEITADFASDSDRPGSVSASLAAGTYVVRVSTYWGGNQFTYRLVGKAVPTGDGAAGHFFTTATTLAPTAARQTVTDWVGDAAREDYYKVTLAAGGRLNLNLAHDGNSPLVVEIKDSSLNTIEYRTYPDNQIGDGLWSDLAAGTYYVRVSQQNSGTNSNYSLTYWTGTTSIGTIADGSGNTFALARDLGTIGATGSFTNENVGGSDLVDYFTFAVGSHSLVNFDINGATGSYRLKLYDATGTEIATIADVSAYGEDRQYLRYLGAGTYYVGVTTTETSQRYALQVTGTAVPPGAGHSFASAKDLGSNPGPTSLHDVVTGTTEKDYFHFALTSPTFVDLTLIARSGGATIQLLDADGNLVGNGQFDATGASEGRYGAMLAAGDYYVVVNGTDGDFNRYTLQINPNALTISAPVLVEGNGGTANLVFTVTLAMPSALPVAFAYATGAGGTALAGSDFAATSGTITIAPGETSATISVPVSGDTLYEADETVQLTLSDASGATFAGGAASLTATGTIKNDDAPPVATISSPSVTEGNSGTKALVYTVTLSAASALPATFSFATSNGTATSSDYTAKTGTLTIAAGQKTGTITVYVTGDTRYEANETVRLTLTNPTGATFAGGATSIVGTGTITNDDAKPVASISGVSVVEGAAGTVNLVYTVTLSAVSGLATTIAYATSDGSATAGSDYAAKTGTLTIGAGQTTGTITVAVNGDAFYEADETVTMTLSSPSGASFAGGGATLSATGTIVNDDAPPVLSISDAVLVEGNSGTSNLVFTVTLSAASGLPVTVAYGTADGSALAGSDYAAATGTLTIAAGQTTGTIVVPVTGDTTYENDETLSLVLSAPTGATLAGGASTLTAQGTITNDDAKPVATISSPTVAEGNSGTKAMTFTITLSEVSALPTTFSFATSNGTATSSDYTARTGTVTIAAGQKTGTVTVNVTGDTRYEGAETVRLTLSSPSGATFAGGASSIVGTGTISNDDAKPTLSIADVAIVEGNSGTTNMVFTVKLSAVSGVETTVKFATSDGSATAGSDYAARNSTLTIAAGATSGTITVAINGDKAFEPDETFNLTLSAPTNAAFAGGATTLTAKGTITNDEFAPPTLTASAVTLEIYDSTTPPAPVAPPALSSLVSVSTQPGDTIQSYQLIDTNAAANSATISVGGVKQAAGTTISLTPIEFANATVVAGTSGTSDTVFVRATGVGGPSGWAPLVVTTSVVGAPVLSVADKSVAAGSSVAASTLATVTTPVPVVAYEFLDLNPDPASGSFKAGGVTQSAGAIIDILSSQLATTSFVAGATGSSDEIWVRASNGTNWSQWNRLSVTAGALAA